MKKRSAAVGDIWSYLAGSEKDHYLILRVYKETIETLTSRHTRTLHDILSLGTGEKYFGYYSADADGCISEWDNVFGWHYVA